MYMNGSPIPIQYVYVYRFRTVIYRGGSRGGGGGAHPTRAPPLKLSTSCVIFSYPKLLSISVLTFII